MITEGDQLQSRRRGVFRTLHAKNTHYGMQCVRSQTQVKGTT